MDEQKYTVSEKVLVETYRSMGNQALPETLRTSPMVSAKSLLKAVNLILDFFAWTQPEDIIGLFLDLKHSNTIKKQDIPSTYYWGWNPSDVVNAACTCSEAIANCIKRQFNRNIIKQIIAIYPNQKLLQDSVQFSENLAQYDVDDKVKAIVGICDDRSNLYAATLALLSMWVNGIYSKNMEDFFNTLDSYRSKKEKITGACSFEGNISRNYNTGKYKTILNRKIMAYLRQQTGRDYKSVGNYLKTVFLKSGDTIDTSRKIEHAGIMNCIESYKLSLHPAYPNTEYIADVVDDVLEKHVLACFNIMIQKKTSFVIPQMISTHNIIDMKLFDTIDVLPYIKRIDIGELLNTCLWAIMLRHTKEQGERFVDKTLSSFEKKRNGADKNESNDLQKVKDLQAKLKKKENHEHHQNGVISGLRDEIARLKAQLAAYESESCTQNWEYERKYHKAINSAKNMESKLRADLHDQQDKITALEEKISAISQSKNRQSEYMQVDTSKKFLFVVDDEHFTPRIKAWFPNSIISTHAVLNHANASSFYMGVFLTGKVTHVSYKHYKDKCILYNIPVANCNGTSYSSICQSIRKCEQENTMNMSC